MADAFRLLELEARAVNQRVIVGAIMLGIPAGNAFLVKSSYWLNL
jgi:hypothetical protein